MTEVQPVDLPRVRDGLLEFAESALGGELRRYYLTEQDVDPGSDIGRVMDSPAPGLAEAMLVYADADLCRLAADAAESLPEFTLDVDDPPDRDGLLWFAEPIRDVDSADEQRPFLASAVGWTARGGYLWITTYVDRDNFPWDGQPRTDLPRYIPMGMWPAPVGEDGQPVPLRMMDVGGRIMSTVKTVWLLMSQTLTDVAPVTLPRAVRRQAARAGRPVPEVRMITLRRPASGTSSESEGREWHHRWLVRGHWRKQPWGPGRSRVRPVWIAPHIKGPEDAPLIGGEKVYVVPGGQPGAEQSQ